MARANNDSKHRISLNGWVALPGAARSRRFRALAEQTHGGLYADRHAAVPQQRALAGNRPGCRAPPARACVRTEWRGPFAEADHFFGRLRWLATAHILRVMVNNL